ncbi:MAG TPA: type III polyketide synthase [Planctomycetota bacterium]|nr:type III polyketide synthase [Planctomycetota bacterium]
MSTIRSTGIAIPPYTYDQKTSRLHVERWLGDRAHHFRRVLDAFESGLVETRSSVLPIEEIFLPRTFREKNDLYAKGALELGERAVRACLDRAGLEPGDIDYFITSSCTGFMIPGVDALLAHRMRMKPSLGRLPISQHGCAGGAVALRQAHEHLAAHPGHRVLVLAVEIPTVTLQLDDLSPENLISTSLFGDGAAAAVLTSGGRGGEPAIVATESCMFPESEDLMGWELRDSGLKILLSKRVPSEIKAHAPGAIIGFLARQGVGIEEIGHYLLHPGGRKIIDGFEASFSLTRNELGSTRSVLRKHGNLSSATVLFVLDEHLRAGHGKRGDLGLLVAFGPGFGCESLLLHWGPRAARRERPATEAPVEAAL